MGMLLGVARGSVEPPRLLVLRYEPARRAGRQVLGLVGKGVTFDTGGISIKPADGMERMKDDMAGGATVVAALRSIALQKLPIRAIAVVPMIENMPGGKATKPGDMLARRVGADRRSEQHRRGGPADSRRRALVCAQARRDASRRRRHADRRRRRRARQDHHGTVRHAGAWVEHMRARPRRGPARRCGRCRCSTTTASS